MCFFLSFRMSFLKLSADTIFHLNLNNVNGNENYAQMNSFVHWTMKHNEIVNRIIQRNEQRKKEKTQTKYKEEKRKSMVLIVKNPYSNFSLKKVQYFVVVVVIVAHLLYIIRYLHNSGEDEDKKIDKE